MHAHLCALATRIAAISAVHLTAHAQALRETTHAFPAHTSTLMKVQNNVNTRSARV